MSSLRRSWPHRADRWLKAKPGRSQHVMQLLVGVNVRPYRDTLQRRSEASHSRCLACLALRCLLPAAQLAVTVALVIAMQARSRRVADSGLRSTDLSASQPELWSRLQQDMTDSILISSLREQELLREAEDRAAQPPSLPSSSPSPPHKVDRVYVIDGRERRVSFINTDPAVFAAKLAAMKERTASPQRQRAATAQQPQQA